VDPAIAALGAWASSGSPAVPTGSSVAREPASSASVALWTLGALVVPVLIFVPCWLGTSPSRSIPSDVPAWCAR